MRPYDLSPHVRSLLLGDPGYSRVEVVRSYEQQCGPELGPPQCSPYLSALRVSKRSTANHSNKLGLRTLKSFGIPELHRLRMASRLGKWRHRRLTAVDKDRGSCEVVRSVDDEVLDDVGDFVRLTDAPEDVDPLQ